MTAIVAYNGEWFRNNPDCHPIGLPVEKVVDGRKYVTISYLKDVTPMGRFARLVGGVALTILTAFVGLFFFEGLRNLWIEFYNGQERVDVSDKECTNPDVEKNTPTTETAEDLNKPKSPRMSTDEESVDSDVEKNTPTTETTEDLNKPKPPRMSTDEESVDSDVEKNTSTTETTEDLNQPKSPDTLTDVDNVSDVEADSAKDPTDTIELLLQDQALEILLNSKEENEKRSKPIQQKIASRTVVPQEVVTLMWILCVLDNKERLPKFVQWMVEGPRNELTSFMQDLIDKSKQLATEVQKLQAFVSTQALVSTEKEQSLAKFRKISEDFNAKISKIQEIGSICFEKNPPTPDIFKL